MKIALVSEWLDPWRGGAETSTRQFLYELVRRGVEVHVFTRSRPAAIPGLEVHTIGGAAMSRTRKSMTFAHRTERLIRSMSFDVVHAISPFLSADVYQPRGGTVAESIERNLALVRSPSLRALKRQVNRLNVKQRYLLAMERRLFHPSGGPTIVAISQYVARQLKEHYALKDERIRLIHNGVDIDATPTDQFAFERSEIRSEFGIDAGDVLVLVIAHNFRLKGVDRWMEALSHLVRRGVSDVKSIVVGKGEASQWHRRARRLGIARVLTFTGPSDRVFAFRHAADVIVHPTFYDPCSRVILEGLSSGLPCISTRWDGAAEWIEDGRNGFVLHEPTDTAILADRVEQLRDPGLRRSMGKAAAGVRDQVSMIRHVTEMLELYNELIVRRDRSRGVSVFAG